MVLYKDVGRVWETTREVWNPRATGSKICRSQGKEMLWKLSTERAA